MDNRRTIAFRSVALIYAATATYVGVIFVARISRHPHEIHSGALGYAIFVGAAAFGLWRRADWGKNVGLIVALGTSAIGALTTVSVVVSHHGPLLGWIVVFVISTALTYVLTRNIFQPLPDDI